MPELRLKCVAIYHDIIKEYSTQVNVISRRPPDPSSSSSGGSSSLDRKKGSLTALIILLSLHFLHSLFTSFSSSSTSSTSSTSPTSSCTPSPSFCSSSSSSSIHRHVALIHHPYCLQTSSLSSFNLSQHHQHPFPFRSSFGRALS